MPSAANLHICGHQRLRVKLIVNDSLEKHAEVRGIYIRRLQHRFFEVCPGAPPVIMLRQNIHLSRNHERRTQTPNQA
jgi:hypothetical protein